MAVLSTRRDLRHGCESQPHMMAITSVLRRVRMQQVLPHTPVRTENTVDSWVGSVSYDLNEFVFSLKEHSHEISSILLNGYLTLVSRPLDLELN